jgi:hypothetical protein
LSSYGEGEDSVSGIGVGSGASLGNGSGGINRGSNRNFELRLVPLLFDGMVGVVAAETTSGGAARMS